MPSLWGGVGGDALWSKVGLGNPGMRGSMSAGLLGLSQGLLSQGPTESWASALGRGIGFADASMRQSRDDALRAEEMDREQKLRDYYAEQGQRPDISEDDRAMYGIMSQLDSGQSAQLFATAYTTKARRQAAGTAAEGREAERLRKLQSGRKTMEIQDQLTEERQGRAREAAAERSDVVRAEDRANREYQSRLQSGLSLERADINRQARQEQTASLESNQMKQREAGIQSKVLQGIPLSWEEKEFIDMRRRMGAMDRMQQDIMRPLVYGPDSMQPLLGPAEDTTGIPDDFR